MKFILISPYSSICSYGIRSISTFLRNHGVSVSVVYLPNSFSRPYDLSFLNQLLGLCKKADLIGISVMSNYYLNCIQLTQAIQSLSIPIAWGGVHPTLSPDECLVYCDIAVRGEGEITLLEIINNLKNNRSLQTIPGTYVKKDGKIFKNEPRPPMPIEDLVVIDHDYSSDYILINNKIKKLDNNLLKTYITSDYMTLSSLGCPFSCSYCINNRLKQFCGSQVRFRKIDDVISELVSAKARMKFIKHVSFDDDAFILRDIKEIKGFCDKYKEKINLPFFVSGINPLYVDEEKIKLLIGAGMDRLRMGIQSGSQAAKVIYNRNIANERIIASAKIINKFKSKLLLTAYDLILDNPFESKADIIETIKLLTDLPAPFTLNLFSLTFYPGTDIYIRAEAAGLIKDNIEDIYKKHYLEIKNTYLNFVIVLFTIFKIPNWLLPYLLNGKIVQKNVMIPKFLFKFFINLGLARRAVNFLLKGDVYTLAKYLRFSLTKT